MMHHHLHDDDEDADAWRRVGALSDPIVVGSALTAWSRRWAAIDKAAPREAQEVRMSEGLYPLMLAHRAGIAMPDEEGGQ